MWLPLWNAVVQVFGCYQEPAIGLLCVLAETVEVQKAVVDAKLLPRLVELLQNPSLQVQECSIAIIRQIADNADLRQFVLMEGVTERLYNFIQSCTVAARDHAGILIKYATFRRDEAVDDEERRMKFAALPVNHEGTAAVQSPQALSRPGSGVSRRKGSSSSRIGLEVEAERRPSVQFSAVDVVQSYDQGSPTVGGRRTMDRIPSVASMSAAQSSRRGSERSLLSPQQSVAVGLVSQGSKPKLLSPLQQPSSCRTK